MLSYTTTVELQKVRLSEFTDRAGATRATRYLQVLDANSARGDTFEYTLHADVNGELPPMGERVGLVLHSYSFEEARVSQRTGNAYIARTEKRRVVGVYDPSKGPSSALLIPEFASAPAA